MQLARNARALFLPRLLEPKREGLQAVPAMCGASRAAPGGVPPRVTLHLSQVVLITKIGNDA